MSAFADLVNRYQPLVVAIALAATGDRGLSEDLAQETFITAWRRIGELRDASKVRPWLCGIVRNQCRAARRHRVRHAPDAGANANLDGLAETAASPLERVIAAQEARIAADALSSLPLRYREPLILFYRLDHSIKEVALGLGLSEDTVKQRLHRGRLALEDSVLERVERRLEATRPRAKTAAAIAGLLAISSARSAAASPRGPVPAVAATSVLAVCAAAIAIALLVRSPDGAPREAALSRKSSVLVLRHGSSLREEPAQDERILGSSVLAEAIIGVGTVVGDRREARPSTRALSTSSGARLRTNGWRAGFAEEPGTNTKVSHGPAVVERAAPPLMKPSLTYREAFSD